MDETARTRFLTVLEMRAARYLSHDQLDVIPLLMSLEVPLWPHGKRAKARALAVAAEEAGRLDDLLDQLRQLRPRARWPAISHSRPETAKATAAPVTMYQIGEINTGGGAFFGGPVTAGCDVNGGADSSHIHTPKE
jgi:hypothetical protein